MPDPSGGRMYLGAAAPMTVLALLVTGLQAATPSPPKAYSVEQRFFYGRPEDPNPVAHIAVSGEWHRLEVHQDGKLRSTQITRPDRHVVYVINDPERTYEERSYEELRAQGWDPSGQPSLEDIQARARRGGLVLKDEGSDTVNGEKCEKYSVATGGNRPSLLWVSAASGLPVLKTIPSVVAEKNIRIEWTNLKLGPQPPELFEPPRGYRKR